MATLVPHRQHSFMSPATWHPRQGKQNNPQQNTPQSEQQSISPVCHMLLEAAGTAMPYCGWIVTTDGTAIPSHSSERDRRGMGQLVKQLHSV